MISGFFMIIIVNLLIKVVQTFLFTGFVKDLYGSGMTKNLLFQCGGPFHPSIQQADAFQDWMPPEWTLIPAHSTEAFDQLDAADVFIAAGLNWTGMGAEGEGMDWSFDQPHGYRRPTESQQEAFRTYVASGKPVLGFHGGIGCYDDWPEFGRLLGCRWDWKVTNHGPVGTQVLEIIAPDHPIASGIHELSYTVEEEEVYVNLQIAQDSPYEVICQATIGGARFPILFAGEGGRIGGSGRWAYFGNGHSLASIQCPQFKPLLLNTLRWLLADG
jgi:type 1 glutamine amidotransferase